MRQLIKPIKAFSLVTLLLNTWQLFNLSLKGFIRNRCILWAATLTYTTVFALIPMLAVTFSLFHAFGGLRELEEKIRPFILKALVPGAQEKLINAIDNLIERLNAGAIGAVGTILVFLTSILLLGQLEIILNEIWGLKKHRPFFYRFALYWTAITLGPPLLALSLAIPPVLRSYRVVSWLENYISPNLFSLLPYLFIWCVFTGIYTFMPNTKVKLSSSAAGGFVAGMAWQAAGMGFTLYTSRVVVYSKFYGTMGLIPLFFLWLFISWSIVLIGAEISFAFQNFTLLRKGLNVYNLSYKEREYLSLRIMLTIAKHFLQPEPPLTAREIATHLNLPLSLTLELIASLLKANILIELDNLGQPSYLPARDLDTIHMGDIIRAVQGNQTISYNGKEDTLLKDFLAASERKLEKCPCNKSLREMVEKLGRNKPQE